MQSPVEGEPDTKSEVPAVVFRPRKRSQKNRKRLATTEENAEQSANGDKENGNNRADLSHADLLLLKEAQKLRDRSRSTALDTSITSAARSKPQDCKPQQDDGANDVVDGLKTKFSVEQSGLAVEERMHKFIEEGMRQKFGDSMDSRNSDHKKDISANDESAVFEIPERWQTSDRPLYDPSEGMPSAGLEEVAIPEEARMKAVTETIEAQKQLAIDRAQRKKGEKPNATTGNLSCNFAHHRHEWIEQNLRPRPTASRSDANATEKDGSSPKEQNSPTKATKPPTGKRSGNATDATFAERFKKRWRR